MRGGPRIWLVVVVALAVGCSSGPSRPSTATTSASTTTDGGKVATKGRRIVVMVEENHSFGQVIGSPKLPLINQMANDGVLLTDYYAITHPSLPNYISLISGDPQGIKTDCGRCDVNAPNLVDQLQRAHISWKVYAQGLPRPCATSPTAGDYAKKHVPFLYFRSVLSDSAACANVVPFTQFAVDAKAGTLPTFVFITPDLASDMHGIGEGGDPKRIEPAADAFAGRVRAVLAASPAWRQDTRLVITWDEGGGGNEAKIACCNGKADGGHVATIVVGPKVKPGKDAGTYDHYSLLRSIETVYGLDHLANANDPTSKDIPALTA